jgi:uncharacterized protein YceH (UPF0502 family)
LILTLRVLSPLEARVLGVLVEKQHTVADSYPLSLNALLMGCNQKTARDPVINATEAELLVALDALKALSLVVEVSGSRVSRYEHNMKRVLGVPDQSLAILTLLLLRGPQTAAELRANTERLHRFADISSVEGFLDELAVHDPARVVKLPRAPGAREQRWAQLLCGPIDVSASAPQTGADDFVAAGEIAALKAEQARMAAELAQLRAFVTRMAGELGIDPGQ